VEEQANSAGTEGAALAVDSTVARIEEAKQQATVGGTAAVVSGVAVAHSAAPIPAVALVGLVAAVEAGSHFYVQR